MSRNIVLGLDGAGWSLLNPWIEAGKLPNLAILRSEAAWGPLSSQLPPVTAPNWRCYATGRNPAKLGVFWWEIVDRQQRAIRHPSSRDFHTRPFWNELADDGHSVAVLNFPTGYPPSPIRDGRFTAGGPGAKDTSFTYPPEWEKELRDEYNYRVHPVDVLDSARQVQRRLDEILTIMQSRFDVAFDLLGDGLDFLHITIFYINVLHHFWYDGRPTLAGWQLIDRNLGRLRQLAADGGYNLILMSDHGSAAVETVFYINTWLAQEGYLAVNLPSAARRMARLGFNRRRLIGLARRSGLAPLIRRLVPTRLQHALPGISGTFAGEAKGERIDWDRTRVIASGQGPIYILVSSDHPSYEPMRDEIIAKLSVLRSPLTGKPVAARVLRREEVYGGPFLSQAPDLVFEQTVGVHTSGSIGHSEVYERPEKWVADNVVEGLFLAWGPDFEPRGQVEATRIIDLAPTVLHLMGLPISKDVDGRVLADLLNPSSEAAQRPVESRAVDSQMGVAYDEQDEEEIADRLSALGYLE